MRNLCQALLDSGLTGMTRRRLVVLDRDGTLIVEHQYLSDVQQVELLPGAASGLRQLQERGLGLIVITNQSGVGRGFFDLARLDQIHRRLHELLHAEGVHLDGIYVCPHTPDDDCRCRKPNTALLELAAKDMGCDLQASFVIGDKACDIALGRRVRATTLLVRTGYGAQVAPERTITPDHVVDDLWEAAQVIRRQLVE